MCSTKSSLRVDASRRADLQKHAFSLGKMHIFGTSAHCDAARILSKHATTVHPFLIKKHEQKQTKIDQFSCMAGIKLHDASKIASDTPRGNPNEGSGAPREGPRPFPGGLGSGPGLSRTPKLAPSWPQVSPSWPQFRPKLGHGNHFGSIFRSGRPHRTARTPPGSPQGLPGPSRQACQG